MTVFKVFNIIKQTSYFFSQYQSRIMTDDIIYIVGKQIFFTDRMVVNVVMELWLRDNTWLRQKSKNIFKIIH